MRSHSNVSVGKLRSKCNVRELGIKGVRKLFRRNHVVYDIKHVFTARDADGRL